MDLEKMKQAAIKNAMEEAEWRKKHGRQCTLPYTEMPSFPMPKMNAQDQDAMMAQWDREREERAAEADRKKASMKAMESFADVVKMNRHERAVYMDLPDTGCHGGMCSNH